MNIREALERKRFLGGGLAGAVIALAALAIFQESRGRHGFPPGVSTQAYYTTEDQLTGQAALDALFVDDVNKAPPFDHNGKPAYLAVVFQCGNNRWVNHLKRYTPDMQKRVQAAMDDWVGKGNQTQADTKDWDNAGTEVKLPGDHRWVGSKDKDFDTVRACHLPDGANMSDLMFSVP